MAMLCIAACLAVSALLAFTVRFGAAQPGFEQVRHAAGFLGGVWAIMPGPEAGEAPDRVEDLRPDLPSHSPAVTASSTALEGVDLGVEMPPREGVIHD